MPNQFRDDLVNAMAAHSALQINDCGYIPSRLNPNEMDLKLVAKTTLAPPLAAPEFQYNKPPQIITNVNEVGPNNTGQLLNVKVKVIHQNDNIDTKFNKNNNNLLLQVKYVSDHSGIIQLSAWESHITSLVPGQSYIISNVVVKQFNEVLSLSTTTSSYIKEIEPLDNARQMEQTTIIGKMVAVDVHLKYKCLSCQALNAYSNMPTVRCSYCNKKQQLSPPDALVYTGNATFSNQRNNKIINDLFFTRQCLQQIVSAMKEVQQLDTTTVLLPTIVEDFLLTYESTFGITYLPLTKTIVSFAPTE